ncbi:response regulator transcription factor [Ruminococcus flavefaciens]|uniref:Stage 0 sporulation protein A homolog n=1 Tax=Ruminococcus flavefaciens TaxID=1265 RepID=A0A315Y1Y5_RUMFL|nr:response regulator transcription factor [Ruminococcus flavefaciens]PWJ14027.1 DNA-binding response OmpR family regulator [Ruminococcus flavefaciens]SSA43653.1 DNA-binding response regulator, OmpR family, contains REC and winged-helix (wHTH) domain [Ruminococcus flavefaciens]
MKKILTAEDDREINRLICEYLSSQGYETLSALNGLDAVRMVREQEDISLLILDLMLPFQSGDMVLTKIREFTDIPVIVVSAKSDTRSKIDLIRMGADDYLTKPFDLDELLVRVEAVLRRYDAKSAQDEVKLLTCKNLTLDVTAGTVTVCGSVMSLTSKEFSILELMLQSPRKLWSKANLFESVWGESYISDDKTVKVHMSNIRQKLKKLDPDNEYIETVWGMGYRLIT